MHRPQVMSLEAVSVNTEDNKFENETLWLFFISAGYWLQDTSAATRVTHQNLLLHC